MSDRLKFVCAITSGLLLTASFPKIGISYLAWIALIPLLFSLKDAPLKQVFRLGFIAGRVRQWLITRIPCC